MQRVKTSAAVIVALMSLNASAFTYRVKKLEDYQEWISSYSAQYDVDPLIVEGIIAIESNFRSWITGDDGRSQGLMQIQVPSAWDVGFRGNASQLRDPRLNIKYGTKYLSWLIHHWELDILNALDAYNRGFGNVKKHPYTGDWREHSYVGRLYEYFEFKGSIPSALCIQPFICSK